MTDGRINASENGKRGTPSAMSDAVGSRLIGESRVFRDVVNLARRLAKSDLPVMLIGETGTGKELLAEEIHRLSGRRGELVDVNCAAFPRDMVEAMLFGHRRGSFTGAHEDARGLIEAADQGTLFLDELQSLAPEAQPKLLRVLESGEVRRVGETSKRRVRLRTVAAAQPAISERAARGQFRQDLLQRLCGAVIWLPTLAERRGDIPLLAQHFARSLGATSSDLALELLQSYNWPGNVRELRLVVERAACLTDGPVISTDAMLESLRVGISLLAGDSVVADRRLSPKDRVLAVCAAHNWNAAATARALGLGRTTLFKELRSLGISLRATRSLADYRARRIEAHRSSDPAE
ncbi:MAG: sigma 54-interacting transcriptional regulator [Gemmatimonadaceae bacterium]